MKFTKPINRELDIDGNTFIVSFDNNGIDFRVKGKRKTAHVNWNRVIDIAEGEDGSSASQILGFSSSKAAQNESERQEQPFARQTLGDSQPQPITHHQMEQRGDSQPHIEPRSSDDLSDDQEERRRAVTAGELGPES